MTVGDRIKKIREEKEISQIDLASSINVSKQTLYKYENNIVTNIPSDKIEAISQILHCSPAYLMGWEDSPSIQNTMVLTAIEKRLIENFRELNKQGQEYILQTMDMVNNKYKKSASVSNLENVSNL